MKEKTGEVFSIANDNAPAPGCTVSKEIQGGDNSIAYFSLAARTDISAEIYPSEKLLIMAAGSMSACGAGGAKIMREGDAVLIPANTLVGMCAEEPAVYVEINSRRNITMNEAIKAGEVFTLAELVPYGEGKIVNMDVASNDAMKFVVMSFDAGQALSEHAAPGEALVFALEGEAVIGYEGKEHVIRTGENFHFAKGGLHSVKARTKFKMALLLTLA